MQKLHSFPSAASCMYCLRLFQPFPVITTHKCKQQYGTSNDNRLEYAMVSKHKGARLAVSSTPLPFIASPPLPVSQKCVVEVLADTAIASFADIPAYVALARASRASTAPSIFS